MAAFNNEQLKKTLQQQAKNSPAITGNVTKPAVQQTTPYTGLAGVSENTQSVLGKYGAGYTPSAAVSQAQKYLSDVVAGKPGAYQSSYKQQLDDLYSRVMNRPKFQYNLGEDMLYQQYKDQYNLLGQQAMMDTTAQAAALTGGYGNSYAATAGNQAYQAYLQQLNNMVPDLYAMAMNQYSQEGQDLMNQYGMAADAENQDYSRYQQDYNNWLAEREAANADYWNQYNADYGQYADQMDYWTQMAAQENAQWNADRDMAYNTALAILAKGNTPSSALLELAGISAADAKKLKASKSSGGSRSGGSSRSSSGGYTPQPTQDNDEEYKPSQMVNDMLSTYQHEINNEGRLYMSVETSVDNMVRSGKISKADGAYILSKL